MVSYEHSFNPLALILFDPLSIYGSPLHMLHAIKSLDIIDISVKRLFILHFDAFGIKYRSMDASNLETDSESCVAFQCVFPVFKDKASMRLDLLKND